jgi:hypothetical protein
MAPRSFIENIAEEAVAPIGQVGGILLVKAALIFLASVGVAVGAAFLTWALYITIDESFGSLAALLVVGGLYIILAGSVAAIVVSQDARLAHAPERAGPKNSGPKTTSALLKAASGNTEDKTENRNSPVPLSMDTSSRALSQTGETAEIHPTGIEPILDRLGTPVLELLREQGMERERLALAAGLTVAKELRPWMLVGLMVGLGIVVGHFAGRQQGGFTKPERTSTPIR